MKGRRIVAGMVALGACAVAHAQFVTLIDNQSTVRIRTDGANAGIVDTWMVGRSADQLTEQSYFYRIGGMNAEARVGSIGAATVTQFTANFVELAWANASFELSIRYMLTGGGPNTADLAEVVRIRNLTSSRLSLSLFEYDDFDLDGADDDTVIFENSSTALQTHGLFQVRVGATPIPTFKELDGFPNTLLKLVDNDIDNLGNNLTTFTGDATFAFQWDNVLEGGETWMMSKNKILTVPEPGSMVALGLGLAAVLARRRKR